MSSSIRIAFVANPSESRELLLRHLVRHGNVEVEAFFSMDELRRSSRGRLFSGVVADLRTIATLDEADKPFFEELARSFPLLRLRQVGEPDEIAGIVAGRPLAGEALLEAFIDGECRKAHPRGVRAEERKALVLSVFVRGPQDEAGYRASVSNVSPGGFFVVTPRERSAERFCLEILDLEDRTPICCEVRWAMPWGTSRRSLPGWGVAIESIKDSQRAALEQLLREAPQAVL